jgi:hypothetical protein
MSKLFIGVKCIIAVDSSEFAYAELDVDAHCMLVADSLLFIIRGQNLLRSDYWGA